MKKETKIIKNIIKISDLIFKEELNKYLLKLKEYDLELEENINISLLTDALETLKLSIECIEKRQIANGISLTRIAFEDLCFACMHKNNNEKFKAAFYNVNYKKEYIDTLQKYSIEKQTNPKAERPQDYLNPKYIREQIYKNEKLYFYEMGYIRLKEYGEGLYDDLCIRTHPSIVRCFLYKFQNTINELNILNYYKVSYCYIILLLIINHIQKINSDKENIITELEMILSYYTLCLIMSFEDSKDFEQDAYNIIEMLKIEMEVCNNENGNNTFQSPSEKLKNIDELALVLLMNIIKAEQLNIDLSKIKKQLGIEGIL